MRRLPFVGNSFTAALVAWASVAALAACGGASCPSFARECDGTCCAAGSICVQHGSAGSKSCATLCTSSSEGGASAPCCVPLGGGSCTSQATCLSVCATDAAGQYCRCASASECSTGCCAPGTDSSGNPVGPYVCALNDGAPYDCCNGTQACSGTSCCAADPNGSALCVAPCTDDSACGATHCDSYATATNPSACAGSPPKGCGL